MQPDDVNAFVAAVADALEKYNRDQESEIAFRAKHADVYRRLRGEFTRHERRIMARRYTATEMALLSGRSPVTIRPQPRSRAPRTRRTRTARATRAGPLADSDEPPSRQLDLLDRAVLTLGWVRA